MQLTVHSQLGCPPPRLGGTERQSGVRIGRSSAELAASATPSGNTSSRPSSEGRLSAAEDAVQEARAVTPPFQSDSTTAIDEYNQLKQKLLFRAKQGSGFLAAYIFLQQGLVATCCSLAGSIAGYIYIQRLMGAIDSYTGQSDVPLVSAREVQNQPFRALAILFAVYRQAITARLLIPTSLAAAVSVWNATQPHYFTIMQEFDMLLGFLFSYKSGLISALYDDIKPKARLDEDERPIRPNLAALPDLEEERKERLLADRRRS